MFRDNLENNNADIEKAKKDYEFSTTVNSGIAKTAKAIISPLESGIEVTQNKVQQQIDLELYVKVAQDADAREKEAIVNEQLTPENIYQYLSDRILDKELPIEARMKYLHSGMVVTGHYTSGLYRQLKSLQPLMNMDSQQNERYIKLNREIRNLSEEIFTLQRETRRHEISLKNAHQKYEDIRTKISNGIAHARQEIGKIEINEEEAFRKLYGKEGEISIFKDVIRTIFEVSPSSSIEGFEHIQEIKQLHDEITNLKINSDNKNTQEITDKIKRLNAYKIQVRAKEKQIDNQHKDVQLAVSGVFNLISVFGDPQLAYQIRMLGKVALEVTDNVGILITNPFNPALAVYAISNLLNSGKNLVALFEDHKETPQHILIIEAIQRMAQELMRVLGKQSEEHFQLLSHQLNKQEWKILGKLAGINENQLSELSFLHSIYNQLSRDSEDKNLQYRALSEQLSLLSEKLDEGIYKQDINKSKKILRHIEENSQFESYNKLSTDIDHIALTNGIDNQLSGPLSLPENLLPSNYFQLANYFKNLINKYTLEKFNLDIPNPMLVLYACVNNLELNIKEFKIPDHQLEKARISQKDINRFKKYKEIITQIKRLMMTARQKEVWSPLIEAYIKASKILIEEIQKKGYELESIYTEKKRLALETVLAYEQTQILDKFMRNIDVGTYGWFLGKKKNVKRKHVPHQDWQVDNKEIDYEHTIDNQYAKGKLTFIQERETQLHEQRDTWLAKTYEAQRAATENHLSIFGNSTISLYHGVRFIKSEDGVLPYLPAPDPLLNKDHSQRFILEKLQEAQALGIGQIVLTYNLTPQSNIFIFNIYFKFLPNHIPIDTPSSLYIAHIEFQDYDPLFYQSSEAVWNYWLGGNITLKKEGITKKWATGQTAIKSEKTSRCITQPEAEQNQWGYGKKGGNLDCEEWNISVPDEPSEVQAKIKIFENPSELKFLINNHHLELIEESCKKEYIVLKNKYLEDFKNHLNYHHDNAFGKACSAFEKASRDLYGLVSYAYFDLMKNSQSELARWFSHQSTTINALRRNKSQSHQEALNKLINSIPRLIEIIEKESHRELSFDALIQIELALDNFISLYEPYAVSSNKHYKTNTQTNEEIEVIYSALRIFVEEALKYISSDELRKKSINGAAQKLVKEIKKITNDPQVIKEFSARLEQEFSKTSTPQLTDSIFAQSNTLNDHMPLDKGDCYKKEENNGIDHEPFPDYECLMQKAINNTNNKENNKKDENLKFASKIRQERLELEKSERTQFFNYIDLIDKFQKEGINDFEKIKEKVIQQWWSFQDNECCDRGPGLDEILQFEFEIQIELHRRGIKENEIPLNEHCNFMEMLRGDNDKIEIGEECEEYLKLKKKPPQLNQESNPFLTETVTTNSGNRLQPSLHTDIVLVAGMLLNWLSPLPKIKSFLNTNIIPLKENNQNQFNSKTMPRPQVFNQKISQKNLFSVSNRIPESQDKNLCRSFATKFAQKYKIPVTGVLPIFQTGSFRVECNSEIDNCTIEFDNKMNEAILTLIRTESQEEWNQNFISTVNPSSTCLIDTSISFTAFFVALLYYYWNQIKKSQSTEKVDNKESKILRPSTVEIMKEKLLKNLECFKGQLASITNRLCPEFDSKTTKFLISEFEDMIFSFKEGKTTVGDLNDAVYMKRYLQRFFEEIYQLHEKKADAFSCRV